MLLLLPAGAFGQGKGRGVEVLAVSPKLVDTQPGGILSLSFRVTSRAGQEEEFIESPGLPAHWQPIIPPGSFVLGPDDSQVRLLAFAIPNGTPAGQYDVTYSVRSRRDYDIADEDTVTVVVLAVAELDLMLEERPDAVIAGDEYQVTLRLVNRGNTAMRVRLEAKTEDNYSATLDPAEVDLPGGRNELVTVTVETDPKEFHRHRHVLQVEARAVGVENGKRTATIAVAVDVIPQVAQRPDLYHRVPAKVVLRTVGDGDNSGVQAELSGSGTLDEQGMREVDFLFRGPDLQGESVFGWRDESWLNYSTPDLDVALGDQGYGLSRLTEYYRYGRGVGVSTHPTGKRIAFGAHYARSRWEQPETEQTGAYVSDRLTDWLTLRLNALRRDRTPSADGMGFDDRLWSMECALSPTKDARLHMEYGRSESDRYGGVEDGAYRVELGGRAGRGVYYSFWNVHAGPDYYGYYRDCDHTFATITFPIGERFQAHVSHQQWKQNLRLDPDRYSAPEERLDQIGIRYMLPRNWYVTLDYDRLRWRDLLQPSELEHTERPVRIGIGRAGDTYNVRYEVRAAEQDDPETGERYHVLRQAVHAWYRPSRQLSLVVYGEIGERDGQGSRLLGGSNNVGASLRWKPGRHLDFNLYYLKYGFDSSYRNESAQTGLNMTYTLRDGSFWNLQARRQSPTIGGRCERSLALSYTVPFGVPVSKKESIGVLRGRVYEGQGPSAVGIPRVILVANGATAVTDKDGRFVFPTLAPGTYSVDLDPKSIGLDRTTEHKLPILATVAAGEITDLDIAVVKAAQVSGSVMVVPANGDGIAGDGPAEIYVVGDPLSDAGPSEPKGLAHILVELANGEEILRRTTDSQGAFLFEGLRPGHWKLKVYDYGLPTFHYVDTPEMELDLGPAESKEIALQVLPKKRRIRMEDANADGSNAGG